MWALRCTMMVGDGLRQHCVERRTGHIIRSVAGQMVESGICIPDGALAVTDHDSIQRILDGERKYGWEAGWTWKNLQDGNFFVCDDRLSVLAIRKNNY